MTSASAVDGRRIAYGGKPRRSWRRSCCCLHLAVLGRLMPPPASGPQARSGATAIAWKACGKRLDCARVRVPLDWSRAAAFTGGAGPAAFTGPTISLRVVRYRASKPKQRIGSLLFMNLGGPGVASAEGVAAGGAGFDEAALGRFDIIGCGTRAESARAPT